MPFEQDIQLNDIVQIEGNIYSDGWIEPEVSFNVTPPHKGIKLKITVWNPDFAPALSRNQMTLEIGNDARKVRNIQLNQIVEFLVKPTSTKTFMVKLNTSLYLPACGYDMRDRASKLIRIQWVEDA